MIRSLFHSALQPLFLLTGLLIVSLAALTAALASEAFFGLEPCILCIYQRIPFILIVLLGVIGLCAYRHEKILLYLTGGSAFLLLINSGIALYHSGIEQKWWTSHLEGCRVPDWTESPQSMLENILSAPAGHCDEISWTDPVLGLSMANYNVVLCFALCLVCLYALRVYRRKPA